MKRKRKVAVVLGGGGARGFAHLGVLLELQSHKIPIDIITGTSMGAAIGAAAALGKDLGKLYRLLTCLDLNDILQVSDRTLREVQRAIGRGVADYVRKSRWREEEITPDNLTRMYELFSLLTANKSFSDLNIPFALVAADLDTGEKVVLDKGKLYRAVAASSAVPGTFYPVRFGNRFLIDGGVVDKVPVDIAEEMGAKAIIAIDTGASLKNRQVTTNLEVMLQSQGITSTHLTQMQIDLIRQKLDGNLLLLRPELPSMTMFAFDRIEETVEAGKQAVHANLATVKKICGVS